jgi:hypothetical protein
VDAVVAAVAPRRIVLFGSVARGDEGPDISGEFGYGKALKGCIEAALPGEDAELVSSDDIDVLVLWNIAGRYTAAVPDGDPAVATSTVDAATRIVAALSRLVTDR